MGETGAGCDWDERIRPLRLAQHSRHGVTRCAGARTYRLPVMVPVTDWLPGMAMRVRSFLMNSNYEGKVKTLGNSVVIHSDICQLWLCWIPLSDFDRRVE